MVEYVADGLMLAPATCPGCGSGFGAGSLRVLDDIVECHNCHRVSRISAMLTMFGTPSPFVPDEKGVQVCETAAGWKIVAFPRRSRSTAWIALVGSSLFLLLAIALVVMGYYTHQRVQLHNFVVMGTAATLSCVGSVMVLKGRYEITVDGGLITVFAGVGRFGSTNSGDWEHVGRICLQKLPANSGVYNRRILVDSYGPVTFGEALSDGQRAWIAKFLYDRARAAQQATNV